MADAGNVSRIAPHQLESLPLGQAAPPSVQFVDSKLKYFIKEYRHRRNVSKYISNASKAASIIGPGALTIVIGLRPILGDSWFAEYSTAIPLVVSACLTGLGAWEAFSDHRWKWIRYRTTLYAIRKIKDEFDFAKKQRQRAFVQRSR